jgi:hypothetical protein
VGSPFLKALHEPAAGSPGPNCHAMLGKTLCRGGKEGRLRCRALPHSVAATLAALSISYFYFVSSMRESARIRARACILRAIFLLFGFEHRRRRKRIDPNLRDLANFFSSTLQYRLWIIVPWPPSIKQMEFPFAQDTPFTFWLCFMWTR